MAIDESGTGQRARAASRLNFFLATRIACAGHDDVVARVRNLSAGGMMIEGDELPAPGAVATAHVRGIGAVTGRIVWVGAHRAGMAFDRPIDPECARRPVSGARRR